MKLIRKRHNGSALLLIASICLVVWFGLTFMTEEAVVFGAISLISLLLLVGESRRLYGATLIDTGSLLYLIRHVGVCHQRPVHL